MEITPVTNIDFNHDNSYLENCFKRVSVDMSRPNQVLNILNPFEYFEKYRPTLKLFRSEKLILKLLYMLPLDNEDRDEIEFLKNNKGRRIDEGILYKILVLVCGRKSGKTAFAAEIAGYETYRLHQFYNPQAYFAFGEGAPMSICLASASSKQAQELNNYVRAAVENSDYLSPYKDVINEKEIRLFSKSELDRGMSKGSIFIHCLHSKSSTIRTYNAFVVLIDEIAWMLNSSQIYSGDAMYRALEPGTTHFKAKGRDFGKVLVMSSPAEKAGMLWDLYEQSLKIKSILCVQYASWEFNPNLDKEDFEENFLLDPDGALMEYAGEFGNVRDHFLPQEKIPLIFQKGVKIVTTPKQQRGISYIVCVDASKKWDRYFLCWAHSEDIYDVEKKQKVRYAFIDGLKYWESQSIKDENGDFVTEDIDIETVENFIIEKLVRRGFPLAGIFYDQFQSSSSIQKFKKMGLNAKETVFTNKYKLTIYGDLKEGLMTERVKCYDEDLLTYDKSPRKILEQEMKHIQRIIKGRTTIIQAPESGKVKTDDACDVVANAVSLLFRSGLHNKIDVVRQPIAVMPIVKSWRS